MNIGLLEDDKSQIELISMWADEAGHRLDAFEDGNSFRTAMPENAFDLLILDWHLPDTSGIDELDWLRGELKCQTPVIFITSRDSEESVAEALDHGADDYIVKPVSKLVTLARINALSRRNQSQAFTSATAASATTAENSGEATENSEFPSAPATIENYGIYEVNTLEQSISVNANKIKLTTKEFELAAYMFHNAGCLITRDHLLEHIWGMRADLNTRTVDTHISRIRAKLGISPATGWKLGSVYQRGYRLSPVSSDL